MMNFVKGIFTIGGFTFSVKSDKRDFYSAHDTEIVWGENDAWVWFKKCLCLYNGFEGRVVVHFSENAVERIEVLGCRPIVPTKNFAEHCGEMSLNTNDEIQSILGKYGSAVKYTINSDRVISLVPYYKTGKYSPS